jgi:hypothetical protein
VKALGQPSPYRSGGDLRRVPNRTVLKGSKLHIFRLPQREQAVKIPRIVTGGYVQDESSRLRDKAIREKLGMMASPSKEAAVKAQEPKIDEKPNE